MKTGYQSYLSEIGRKVKQYRVNANLTQRDLEKKSGVSTRSISRLEQGVSGPVSSGFRCGKPGMNIQIIWGNIRVPEIFK